MSTHRPLPECNMGNLPAWFLQLESAFKTRKITDPARMYAELVEALRPELMELVYDAVSSPDTTTYLDLKELILKRARPNPTGTLHRFLLAEGLGGRSPRGFLRHLRQLLTDAGQEFTVDLLRNTLIARLPIHIRPAVYAPGLSLDDIATTAERIIAETPTPPAVAAAVHFKLPEDDIRTTLQSMQREIATLTTALHALHTRAESPDTRPRSHHRRQDSPSPHRLQRRTNSPSPHRRQENWRDSRRNSPSPRRNNYDNGRNNNRYPRDDGLCRYHAEFGANAFHCAHPCSWSGNYGSRK